VFDLDGTLLDTESLVDEINDTVLRHYGSHLTEPLRRRLLGRTGSEVNLSLAAELEIDVSEIASRRRALLAPAWARATLMPGARELLDRFAAVGVPQGIATGSEEATMRAKLARFPHVIDAMQTIVCIDNPPGQRPKPAPDPFLIAAMRLGVDPSECLAFEDSPPGIASAVAAGMKVIAVGSDIDPAASIGVADVIGSLHEFALD
jgi:pseudouridine 5'-phosphatase